MSGLLNSICFSSFDDILTLLCTTEQKMNNHKNIYLLMNDYLEYMILIALSVKIRSFLFVSKLTLIRFSYKKKKISRDFI
jgi:hypothetical protein